MGTSGTKIVQSNGVGFLGLLGVAFIVLKLANLITWSWWYVLLPLYGPLALVLVMIVIVAIYYMIKRALE